jgi:hypothetical protein
MASFTPANLTPFGPQYPKERKNKKATVGDVLRLIRKSQEPKYLVTASSTSYDYAGAVASLSAISQGDTDSNRIGDQVLLDSIEFNCHCYNGDAVNALHFAIFRWIPNSSSPAPTPTLVLQGINDDNAPNYPFNHDNRALFQVVWHKRIIVTAAQCKQFSAKINLQGSPLQFVAAGTSGMGHMFVLIISDSSTATHPAAPWICKLIYRDG